MRLRDLGNTVLVVEHDEQMMRSADWLVDMGPGAGEHGGHVVAEGTAAKVERTKGSVTGQFLSGKRAIAVPERRGQDRGFFKVFGATQHNLKGIDVDFPVGNFICVTGVSGSGKSTLVNEIVYKALANRLNRVRVKPGDHDGVDGIDVFDKVIEIDQKPIGRTPRSNPATYTDLFTHIRELYSLTPESKVRGYKPGRFSFNVRGGRCETCKGDGQIKIEMHFLPDVYVPCETCKGARYNRETLEVRFKGKSIADVLDMSVEEALRFFAKIPKLRRRLQTLHDVGLDYMRLGQPATTLSGGEAQRVKLAAELCKVATGTTLYILDEPTTGLHFADIEKLLEVLQRLVDGGKHRARDRAQPRRDQAGGLARRPRARGRRGGRRADRGRIARGRRRGRGVGDGAVPARDPRSPPGRGRLGRRYGDGQDAAERVTALAPSHASPSPSPVACRRFRRAGTRRLRSARRRRDRRCARRGLGTSGTRQEKRTTDAAPAPGPPREEDGDPAAAVAIGLADDAAPDLVACAHDAPERRVETLGVDVQLAPTCEIERPVLPVIGERLLLRRVERRHVALGVELVRHESLGPLRRLLLRVEVDPQLAEDAHRPVAERGEQSMPGLIGLGDAALNPTRAA